MSLKERNMEAFEDLVVRAQTGDAAAFEEIVRLLSRRAVATAHFICGDLQTGEEAAQDAFVLAWRKIRDLKRPGAFRAWFGAILARTAIRARRAPHVSLPDGAEPAAPPAGAEEAGELPGVARRLKPKYREVLALRYVDGLSYRDIAKALGLTVARVKSRLHDGRELVRRRIEEGRRERG
jgi:RNA polymerase sigma-70 factor (ECF subfamily)